MNELEVLVIQPDDLCPPALIGHSLRRRGIGLRIVNTDIGESLPTDPTRFGGLLILGGRQSVLHSEQQEFVATVGTIVQAYHNSNRPTLGICLGAQLVTAAFGAPVHRVGELQFGFVPVYPHEAASRDPIIHDMAKDQYVFTWHEDYSDLPAGAIQLLSSDAITNYGYRLGDNTWAFQCHPEVRHTDLKATIGRGGHLIPKHLGERGQLRLDDIDHAIETHLDSAMQFGTLIGDRWADRIIEMNT